MGHEKFVRKHFTKEEREKFLKDLDAKKSSNNKLAEETVDNYIRKLICHTVKEER